MTRIFYGLLCLAMIAAIFWAFGAGDYFAGALKLWTIPRGRVEILGKWIGIAILIPCFFSFHRTLLPAILWSVALALVGYGAAALWMAMYGREMLRRLSRG